MPVDFINPHLLPDRLSILVFALAINVLVFQKRILAQVPSIFKPGAIAASFAWRMESKLNRPARTASDLRIRGFFISCMVIAPLVILGYYIEAISHSFKDGWVIAAFTLGGIFTVRQTFDTLMQFRKSHYDEDFLSAREDISLFTNTDLEKADSPTLIRMAAEGAAHRLSSSIASPAMWYLLLGLPGAMLAYAAHILKESIMKDQLGNGYFASFARFIVLLVQFIPIYIACVLIGAAAMIAPSASMAKSAREMRKYSVVRGSSIFFWAVAAMAGAADIALGGPRNNREGKFLGFPWIGDASAKARTINLNTAISVYAITCVIMATGALLVLLILK